MSKVGFYRAADLVTPLLHSLNAQLMLERENPWDRLVFGMCERSSSLLSGSSVMPVVQHECVTNGGTLENLGSAVPGSARQSPSHSDNSSLYLSLAHCTDSLCFTKMRNSASIVQRPSSLHHLSAIFKIASGIQSVLVHLFSLSDSTKLIGRIVKRS